MILAFETATNICSVAFKNVDGQIIEQRSEERGAHSEKLFLFVQKLMDEQHFAIPDLRAVLVSAGPGSYTGLRIAASGVKGLLFGSKVPLYSMQTLPGYAMAVLPANPSASVIHSVIDARRKHLYHQIFDAKEGRLKTSNTAAARPIVEIEELINPGDTVIGTGLERIAPEVLEEARVLDSNHISARSLITLFENQKEGDFFTQEDPASFSPKYYSSQVAG